ncbi:hypothetical protein RHSIM_Rhsim06G0085900 [Rhododendron simsii]|uniref:Uncharacterized protein n=1 Tax=Rhododendron simsii TaxID=118357 RepID=A0A834GSV0_RHOSS|nr:hypothetical protein RHSIM_Rhsim06G0085900 [Rhododendron simsii]
MAMIAVSYLPSYHLIIPEGFLVFIGGHLKCDDPEAIVSYLLQLTFHPFANGLFELVPDVNYYHLLPSLFEVLEFWLLFSIMAAVFQAKAKYSFLQLLLPCCVKPTIAAVLTRKRKVRVMKSEHLCLSPLVLKPKLDLLRLKPQIPTQLTLLVIIWIILILDFIEKPHPKLETLIVFSVGLWSCRSDQKKTRQTGLIFFPFLMLLLLLPFCLHFCPGAHGTY